LLRLRDHDVAGGGRWSPAGGAVARGFVLNKPAPCEPGTEPRTNQEDECPCCCRPSRDPGLVGSSTLGARTLRCRVRRRARSPGRTLRSKPESRSVVLTTPSSVLSW